MGPLGPTGAFSPDPLDLQGDNSAHAKWAPKWAPMGPSWAPAGPRVGPSGPLWAPPFGAFDRSLAPVETWDGPRRAGAVGAWWAPAANAWGAWEECDAVPRASRGAKHHDPRQHRQGHPTAHLSCPGRCDKWNVAESLGQKKRDPAYLCLRVGIVRPQPRCGRPAPSSLAAIRGVQVQRP